MVTLSSEFESITVFNSGRIERSISTAYTFFAVCAKETVNDPRPAPISKTTSFRLIFDRATIILEMAGSARKFCPSFRLGKRFRDERSRLGDVIT
jgi:hypothetical protein